MARRTRAGLLPLAEAERGEAALRWRLAPEGRRMCFLAIQLARDWRLAKRWCYLLRGDQG